MTRKLKSKSMHELHREQNLTMLQWAHPLAERFPNVQHISISLTTTPEAQWMGGVSTSEKTFSPENKAYFRFPCRFTDCVAGTLDLDGEICELIGAGGTHRNGTAYCDGWQDENRIDKHRCHLLIDYKIAITYREQPVNGLY